MRPSRTGGGRIRAWSSRIGRSIAVAAVTAVPCATASLAGTGATIAQLSGLNPQPMAVASGGSFIVGAIGNGYYRAVRWTTPTAVIEFADPPQYVSGSSANDVSDDGATIVGSATSNTYGPIAVLWTMTGAQGLWGNGGAAAVSGDGRVVVGTSDIDPWAPYVSRAMRWSADLGASELPLPPAYQQSGAADISADGRRILGQVVNATESVPIIWDDGGGYELLPSIPGATTVSASRISGDGATVAVSVNANGSISGALWSASTGYRPIVVAHRFQPLSITHDGSIVVGTDGGTNAYRWSNVGGMRLLREQLAEGGADLTGWSELNSATAISPDGRWISGRGVRNGQQTGFIAFVPLDCPGDILEDRSVNGADLGAVLSYWGPVTASPVSRACDLNDDGIVNGADLGVLLVNWGACP